MSILAVIGDFFDRFAGKPSGATKLRDGDTLLVSVQDGRLIAQTFDVALSHAEFVKRHLGSLPEGAWVGTIRKTGRHVIALNSKTFFGNQLPGPQSVQDAVRAAFR
jgi:hypothetical protein